MSSLTIVHYPEPVLLAVAKPVGDEDFGEKLRQLANEMFSAMYEAGGVGLAAPQVAISKRIFVMDVPPVSGGNGKLIFVNPEIITVEGEQTGEEGCLSFPGIYQTVQREMRVVIRGRDADGVLFEKDLTNLEARCVLHENDHLDGIVFLDRMSKLKREMAKRKIKRLANAGEWAAV